MYICRIHSTKFRLLWSSCFFDFNFFFFILDESNLEDSSDDNRSSSLGRSAPSDDMSVASDYQEEGATEREFKPLYEHMSVFTRMSNACKLW